MGPHGMGQPAATARSWLEIARPVAMVRAHFFDVEHAIAKQIYHGVALSWAPREKGQIGDRRVRREMRVLDRPVVDDVVVGEREDGAWEMRFVEGTNEGARLVAKFEANEGAAGEETRVDIEAFAPPAGFSFGLGKLSPMGLEKTLKKMLHEHQRALEGYDMKRAPTVAASVIAALDDWTESVAKLGERERRALVALFLEVAAAVAIADNDADDEERSVLDAVARALSATELDSAARAKLVKSAEAAAEKQGIGARCEKLGGRLKNLGFAELGLGIAAIVAEVSHGIDPPEMAALQKIAASAGVPEAGLASILSRIDQELADAKPRPPATAARAEAPNPPPLPPGAKKPKG